jgi:CheY-like chemotaxis protein
MNRSGPILVVDDDEDIRIMLAMALGTGGYSVETAADGIEALQLLSAGLEPSLVLLDMMMPRMDGETFLRAMREKPSIASIPVVLLSGDNSTCKNAQDLHADGCIVKPVELDDLLGTVKRVAVTRPPSSLRSNP